MFYFIRHGQSQANADGIIAGWQDSPLTELGLRQAREAAQAVRESGIRFDLIITSPLSRAADTARVIAREIDYPLDKIIVIDGLREKFGGSFEGRVIAELGVASAEEARGEGAESLGEFAGRVERTNQEIERLATGATLIVGHSGFYRMAEVLAKGMSPDDMPRALRPDNGRLLAYPL